MRKGSNMKLNKETKQAKETRFEAGEDRADEFDMDQGTKTVNVELPVWTIKALDKEATRRGVARQALMKMWLVDRLDAINVKQAV